MARRDDDETDERPVSKAEFVGLMVLLAQRDRARYRQLREFGWSEAISPESEIPN